MHLFQSQDEQNTPEYELNKEEKKFASSNQGSLQQNSMNFNTLASDIDKMNFVQVQNQKKALDKFRPNLCVIEESNESSNMLKSYTGISLSNVKTNNQYREMQQEKPQEKTVEILQKKNELMKGIQISLAKPQFEKMNMNIGKVPLIKQEEIKIKPVEIKKPVLNIPLLKKAEEFIQEKIVDRNKATPQLAKKCIEIHDLHLSSVKEIKEIKQENAKDNNNNINKLDQLEQICLQHIRLNSDLNFHIKSLNEKIKEAKSKLQLIGYIKESIEYQ